MSVNPNNIRVLMFGWEFPPFNSGGLGVACEGLTRGLTRQGVNVTFILPKVYGPLRGEYMRILAADKSWINPKKIRFRVVDSILKPYLSSQTYSQEFTGLAAFKQPANIYGADLFSEVRRYAVMAKRIAAEEDYDVIHCHDWLTFPAGIVAKHIARSRGMDAPLIVHVHATEFDRTGGNPNQYVYDIEREGMHAADYVIAVSNYTKGVIVKHYGIDPRKVYVVHNAIDYVESPVNEQFKIKDHHKIVLFLGRMTIQKGPDHFLKIAKKVSDIDDSVRYIMVGSGDMATRVIEEAAKMGIGDKVLFSDFLTGRDVDRAYKMADIYVMNSISEPFGITPLEAMKNGTPVLISKQSGVSEVLRNCLVADFWDIDLMASKILSVLHNEEFREYLSREGLNEVKNFSWDIPAKKCLDVYVKVLEGR